ncbi:hypothetical protein QAD02_006942 [Eretmocerus hayati]|uniref:Uncharacterized protein n=1 Tax=Eretmocerus hayati TaxID=131215 RepID=A0ACC2N6N7_9HYME|nr:hypothetical protein QAD02_006942 [Eretmocerus hayati]
MARIIISAIVLGFFIYAVTADDPDENEPHHRERRFSGLKVSIGPHPHVVSLLYYGDHICSGSILAADIILTAAHCVTAKWHEKLVVSLRGVNPKLVKTEFAVTNIEYHSSFHSVDFINDVALLKIRRPIPLGNHVASTKLPTEPRAIAEGSKLTYYNWASIIAGPNHMSDRLISDHLAVISKGDCAKMYKDVTVESLEGQFCANFTKSYDTFSGDTGGPLMASGYQVGIVSTSQCGTKILPEISTDVSAVLGWILEKQEELMKTRQEYSVIHPLTQEELDYYRSWYGYPALTREVPFMVALVDTSNGQLVGVGSIISEDMILTTAQCAKNVTATVKAFVGKIKDKYGEEEYEIAHTYIHDDFNENVSPHIDDIALLRVRPEFKFSENVGKAELYGEDEKVEANVPANIYGWVEGRGLHFSNLSINHDDECSWLYGSHGGLFPGQICAKSRFGMCNQRVGEPLVTGRRIVGLLTKFYLDCADYRYPAIYTKVSNYRSWINGWLKALNEREDGGLRK